MAETFTAAQLGRLAGTAAARGDLGRARLLQLLFNRRMAARSGVYWQVSRQCLRLQWEAGYSVGQRD